MLWVLVVVVVIGVVLAGISLSGGKPLKIPRAAPQLATRPESNFDSVRALAESGKVVHAIKEYRELTGAGLKESKEAVEGMLRGEPPRHSVVPRTSPAPAADVEALVDSGRLIDAIKRHREITGSSLKEAKEAIDRMVAERRR